MEPMSITYAGPDGGMETLPPGECLRLLAATSVGRVGVSVGALPAILPVNYVLDGDRIVFRTGAGAKLASAVRNAVVCFEVDRVDETWQSGWSVLVTGMATELTGADAERARSLPLHPWNPAAGDH